MICTDEEVVIIETIDKEDESEKECHAELIITNDDQLTLHGKSIHGDCNIIYGNGNVINGNKNIVIGNCNIVNGDNNEINGEKNHVNGNNNTLRGSNNTCIGEINSGPRRARITTKRRKSNVNRNTPSTRRKRRRSSAVNKNAISRIDEEDEDKNIVKSILNKRKEQNEQECVNLRNYNRRLEHENLQLALKLSALQYELNESEKRKKAEYDIKTKCAIDMGSTSSHTGKTTQEGNCVICKESKSEIVFVECGHICLCELCSLRMYQRSMDTCPICRRKGKRTKIFYT